MEGNGTVAVHRNVFLSGCAALTAQSQGSREGNHDGLGCTQGVRMPRSQPVVLAVIGHPGSSLEGHPEHPGVLDVTVSPHRSSWPAPNPPPSWAQPAPAPTVIALVQHGGSSPW